MERLSLMLVVFVLVSTASGDPTENRPRYEYARLVISGLKGSPRSNDDFHWTFPSDSGETSSVFKTSEAEMCEYFAVDAKKDAVHAVINKISGLGWRLVGVHRVESYKENGFWTPFSTHYHFVREKRPNKTSPADR